MPTHPCLATGLSHTMPSCAPSVCALTAAVHSALCCRCLALYWPSAALLMTLQCMHIVWMGMFLQLLYRILVYGSPHAAGREVYEGESDEE